MAYAKCTDRLKSALSQLDSGKGGQGLAEDKQGIWLARSEKPSEGTFNRSYDRGLEIPESVSIFHGIAVLVVSEANGENALCYEDIRYL